MKTNQGVSRRTVLRGLGVSLALPWLESLAPQAGSAAEALSDGELPRRMVFLFVPNGAHMPDWTPAEEGPLPGKLPPTLTPLSAHREYLTALSGLALDGGRAHGDGPGDHARCVASFLTTAHPRKTSGKDIRNGVSVDQVAATQLGHRTRLPSLELGCEPSAQAGRCDSGYSCIYTSNMSWRTATSPMTKETNPRAVFDRLFGDRSTDADRRALAGRDRRRQSILDFVAEDAQSLKARLEAADRQKLDEYLYAVRSIERRIEQTEKLTSTETGVPDFPRPAGVPKDFGEHVRLMMDMIVLALSTDSTRIVSLMYTNAGSNRSYPNVGVDRGHHSLSHHGNDPKKQADIAKINRYHVEQLDYLLKRLRGIEQSGGRNLLDQTMMVYGSGIGDGNRHNHDNLPILLLGKGGGTIQSGHHLRYPEDTPLANLYLAMLRRMGSKADEFGDSSGELEGLA